LAGASAAIPLLQFQVTGQAKKAFIYRVAVVVRNALLQHPDTAVRRMQDLETILSIRLVLGEDSQSGPADPDGAGVVESQPAALDHCVHTELQGRERTASLMPLPWRCDGSRTTS